MSKTFIIFVFLLTSLLYAIYSYFVLNYKMYYMDAEYPMWLEVKQIVNTKTDSKVDLIVLGDSRAKAGFIPNQLPIKSINLSLGGATPIEGYYTLKKYLENNPAPKKLVLSYTAIHLGNKTYYWSRTAPFGFLSDNEYQEVEALADKFKEEPIMKVGRSYIDFKFPKAYGSSFKNGIIGRRWQENKIVFLECLLAHGHHYFGTAQFSNALNNESKKMRFVSSALHNYYLQRLLKLANMKHIELYFYIMPYNEASFKHTNKQYINDYANNIKNLSLKYNIKMCDKPFYMSNHYFGDSSHLYEGAKKSTSLIFECIQ
ncbi:MAG: hypothetical protein QM497_02400 [Sulfurimonas sp.]